MNHLRRIALVALLLAACQPSIESTSTPPSEPPAVAEEKITTMEVFSPQASGVNLREMPDTNSDVILTLPNGSEVMTTHIVKTLPHLDPDGERQVWTLVVVQDRAGWVFSKLLHETKGVSF